MCYKHVMEALKKYPLTIIGKFRTIQKKNCLKSGFSVAGLQLPIPGLSSEEKRLGAWNSHHCKLRLNMYVRYLCVFANLISVINIREDHMRHLSCFSFSFPLYYQACRPDSRGGKCRRVHMHYECG